MILYTPLSQEDVFPTANDAYSNRQFMSYEGKSVYVEQNNDGSYQLLQLMSTDPQDFLNEKFTPGSILS
ncbi:YlzJ-like family protein [Virgibacillus kimchii]